MLEHLSERIRTMWEICENDQHLLNPSFDLKQCDLEPFFDCAPLKDSTMANAIATSISDFENDSGYFSAISSNSTSPLSENETNPIPQKRLPRVQRINNNYCETVAVKSSAHVAQIVGKNGCRIKHLRAKYGTYIHTPSTSNEPVFIIKGQRDKVLEVKQEIVKADNHFTNIKEARSARIAQMINSSDAISMRLFVPNKYIGLVVGRNGWFVKELQSKHNIYIETPKFDICNFFQLYGQRDKLLIIKQLIFEHISNKTGINFAIKYDLDDIYFVETLIDNSIIPK